MTQTFPLLLRLFVKGLHASCMAIIMNCYTLCHSVTSKNEMTACVPIMVYTSKFVATMKATRNS